VGVNVGVGTAVGGGVWEGVGEAAGNGVLITAAVDTGRAGGWEVLQLLAKNVIRINADRNDLIFIQVSMFKDHPL
jgi:hypothetical protein